MGAGGLKVFLSVTLPLSFPGILSSFLFIAVSVLSDFGNPMIVGGRFKVLADCAVVEQLEVLEDNAQFFA